MFKHSDVLIPLKVSKPRDKSVVLTTHTVKKRTNEDEEESSTSDYDMCVRIPVDDLVLINGIVGPIPKFRDGLSLMAGVAIVNKVNRYRFIINNGFVIDSRLVDEKTYYKAYLGRIRASKLNSNLSNESVSMTLYYGETDALNTEREREFRAELSMCFMTCGYD